MAIKRMTAEQAQAASYADLDRIEATTEDQIRQHMAEDGFNPDDPFEGLLPVIDPVELRQRLNLSQDDFADHLRMPVDMIRAGKPAGASRTPPFGRFSA